MRSTARGEVPENEESAPVPTDRRLPDGQHADHWVLPPEERAKGYIRPVRRTYKHVGIAGPHHALRDLTPEECDLHGGSGYVKYETYPPERAPAVGRFWTQEQLGKVGNGCGTVTRMPESCAETYARQPSYYGSTFCCGCGQYLPVGAQGEFIWDDGSGERVGT